MDYKTRFKPLERLGRDGWKRMGEAETDRQATRVELPVRRKRRLVADT
jgi:arginine-tRNA-protein transferase